MAKHRHGKRHAPPRVSTWVSQDFGRLDLNDLAAENPEAVHRLDEALEQEEEEEEERAERRRLPPRER